MKFHALCNFLGNGISKKKGDEISQEEAEQVGLEKVGYLFAQSEEAVAPVVVNEVVDQVVNEHVEEDDAQPEPKPHHKKKKGH